MKILSMNTGHDAAVCLFEDFDLVFHAKEERLNRVKTWGMDIPWLSLRAAYSIWSPETIDCLVLLRGSFPIGCFKPLTHRSFGQRARYWFRQHILGKTWNVRLDSEMANSGRHEPELLDYSRLRQLLGLRPDCAIEFSNHHLCHGLPTIFYSPHWDSGLVYTADGVGDGSYYSTYYFDRSALTEHFGGDSLIWAKGNMATSMGRLYGAVTRAAGFKENRHEGKITGLAAYGKPEILNDLRSRFFLNGQGRVESTFQKYSDVVDYVFDVAKTVKIENLAASVQTHLEEIMRGAVEFHRKQTSAEYVGLSGGVFANVRVNQIVAESKGVSEVFIYPAMGDEGLAVGAALDFCRRKYGWTEFMNQRRDMGIPYYGEEFNQEQIAREAQGFCIERPADVPTATARLIQDSRICALFTKGMEYGPRALGARSILATPRDPQINRTLNERLTRTEFMPFAPVVREERLTEVFHCPPASARATKYMTITCHVHDQWREKIPAIVHVDGTARPQSITRQDNPIYYDILKRFEEISGLPCLINTSFNAHEEPIINTPGEALRALEQKRIDYLVTDEMIISTSPSQPSHRSSVHKRTVGS